MKKEISLLGALGIFFSITLFITFIIYVILSSSKMPLERSLSEGGIRPNSTNEAFSHLINEIGQMREETKQLHEKIIQLHALVNYDKAFNEANRLLEDSRKALEDSRKALNEANRALENRVTHDH